MAKILKLPLIIAVTNENGITSKEVNVGFVHDLEGKQILWADELLRRLGVKFTKKKRTLRIYLTVEKCD